MKIIEPFHEILAITDHPLQIIEQAGRCCYKSEDKITDDSAGPFVSKIAKVFKHESVLEHASMTVRFICDRGVTHELVRHRLCSFSQESSRYCNYAKGKFEGISVIPMLDGLTERQKLRREDLYHHAESVYLAEIEEGIKPQQARDNLPTCLKTEIVHTANFREWKHIFKLRCADVAHPMMRKMMIPLRDEMVKRYPEVFGE